MSETAGNSSGVQPEAVTHTVTESRAATPSTARETAHEAYAFACMRCGHGWEQSYDIEHHLDAEGRPFVVYFADGQRVASPLTRPTCEACGAHVVRIMRPGRVSQVADALHLATRTAVPITGTAGPVGNGGSGVVEEPPHPDGAEHDDVEHPHHHWHLSDLLHPFQHHRR